MSFQRFLVVSLGSIGRRHLANLRALRPSSTIGVLRLRGPPSEVVQGADLTFGNLDDAIAFLPDAAIICSPATTHIPIALQLATAGIHLLIEKPLATAAREIDQLIKLIQANKVIAAVGYNLRFDTKILAIKRALDSHAIGNLNSARASVGQYLPDWRPEIDHRQSVSARSELGGGALLELSHELDYLLWMFGKPSHVFAAGGNTGVLEIDVEDLIEMTWKYPSGKPVVSVHMDMLDRAANRSLRVIGTEGTLAWDTSTKSAARFCPNKRTWDDLVSLNHCSDTYVAELTNFLNCAEQGIAPECSLANGRDVLNIVEAARASLQSGVWTPVA